MYSIHGTIQIVSIFNGCQINKINLWYTCPMHKLSKRKHKMVIKNCVCVFCSRHLLVLHIKMILSMSETKSITTDQSIIKHSQLSLIGERHFKLETAYVYTIFYFCLNQAISVLENMHYSHMFWNCTNIGLANFS